MLFDNAPRCAEDAVIAAAKSNSGENTLSLKEIKTICEAERLKWPSINKSVTGVELIGENVLHIDAYCGEEIKTVVILEEVEIFEAIGSFDY